MQARAGRRHVPSPGHEALERSSACLLEECRAPDFWGRWALLQLSPGRMWCLLGAVLSGTTVARVLLVPPESQPEQSLAFLYVGS